MSSIQFNFAPVASGLTPAFFFGGIFTLSNDETILGLVTIPSRILPEFSWYINGQEFEYPFNVNAEESEYSKTDESGNIYTHPEKFPLV